MKTLIEFPIKSDDPSAGKIVVEVEGEEPKAGERRVSRVGEISETVTTTFHDALGKISPAVDTILSTLRGINEPDEVEVAFGIKMSAKAGAFLASADAEANFNVKITWKKK